MSARYAPSTAEHLSPHFLGGRKGGTPALKIRGAYPVVRRAILAKHYPTLRPKQAEEAGSILKRAWPEWQDGYVRYIAAAAGVGADELIIPEREQVRNRHDGKTPMIDLPRVRSTTPDYPFDQRNCVALCVEDEFSSKIWTRVGRPQDLDECSLKELRELTERYRHQAITTGDWFYREFFEVTAEAFRGTHRRRASAELEVTTVVLRVDGDITDEDVESWLFDGDSPNLDNAELWHYLRCAANINETLQDLEASEHRWLAMPATVTTADGVIASRRVLYLSRPIGDVVQIVGIALDDSGNAELANDVALKLSRFIANGI